MSSQITVVFHCLLYYLFRRRSRKKNKAPRHWLLWGEFTGDPWIHRSPVNCPDKRSVTRKMLHLWRHHDITIAPLTADPHIGICPALMTSMVIDVLALCYVWSSEGKILTTGVRHVFCCSFFIVSVIIMFSYPHSVARWRHANYRHDIPRKHMAVGIFEYL